MGQFTGRLVTSFVMFLIALTLLVLGYTLGNWLQDSYSYEADYSSYSNYNNGYGSGNYLSGSSNNWWNSGPSGSRYTQVIKGAGYTSAMRGTLLAAISLTSICLLLSIIMMCADLCFRITQGMSVIPKATTGLTVLAGILASVTCALYLVRFYVFEHAFGSVPNYPFFLVLFTGILLKIAGCVNNGAKQAGVIGVSGTAVSVMASQSQSQSVPQSLSAYNLYNQSSLPYGGANYAPGMMSGSQFQSNMPPGYQQQMFNAPPYIGVNPNPNPEPPQSTLIDVKKSTD